MYRQQLQLEVSENIFEELGIWRYRLFTHAGGGGKVEKETIITHGFEERQLLFLLDPSKSFESVQEPYFNIRVLQIWTILI